MKSPEGVGVVKGNLWVTNYTFALFTVTTPLRGLSIRSLNTHKSFFNTLATSLGLLTILCSLFFIIQYHYYARIVDQRLSSQALHHPAGIYASPVHLAVGKQISKEDLRERLLRAGYTEGAEVSDFTSGNFIVNEDSIEIQMGLHKEQIYDPHM